MYQLKEEKVGLERKKSRKSVLAFFGEVAISQIFPLGFACKFITFLWGKKNIYLILVFFS